MKTQEIYVCPTCRDWRYLETFVSMNPLNKDMMCYCRKCEEGPVRAIVATVNVTDFPIAQEIEP